MYRIRFKKVYKDEVGAKAAGIANIGDCKCTRCGVEATTGYLHDTKKTVVCTKCSRHEDLTSGHWVPTVDIRGAVTVERLRIMLRDAVIGKLRLAIKPQSAVRGKTLASKVRFHEDDKVDRKLRKAVCERLGL